MSVSLVQSAQQIVDEVNEAIRSGQERLDICEVGLHSGLEERTGKLGYRFIQFNQDILHLQKVRKACELAAESLKSSLNNFDGAFYIAVGMFGVGKCSEMAYVALLKAKRVANSILLQLTNDPLGRMIPPDGHFIVLMNVEKIPSNTRNILEIFKQLKDAYILDPLLKVACSAADVEINGKPLLKYIELFQTNYLYHKIEEISSEVVIEEAKLVEQKAREILPSISAKDIQFDPLNFIRWYLAEKVAPPMIAYLKKFAPQWKVNTSEGILVLSTKVMNSQMLIETLKGVDLLATSEKNRVSIQNPDPEKFKLLQ